MFVVVQTSAVACCAGSDVDAWFESFVQSSDKELSFPGVRLTYERVFYSTLTDDEYQSLAALIAKHPEHPRKDELQLEKRRRRDGADVFRNQLWIDAGGAWRYSADSIVDADGVHQYRDVAWTPQRSWSITPRQLVVAPSDSSGFPPEAQLKAAENTFLPELRRLMFGDTFAANTSGLALQPASQSGNVWKIVAERGSTSSPPHIQYEFTLERSSQESGWHVVESRIVAHETAPSYVNTKWVFEDWHLDPLLKMDVARQATFYDASGRKVRSLRWKPAERESTPFATLAELPRADGTDPVRGPSTFVTANNYDAATSVSIDRATRSPVQSTSLAVPNSVWSNRYRWVGWVVIVGLVSLFVWIRTRRS